MKFTLVAIKFPFVYLLEETDHLQLVKETF